MKNVTMNVKSNLNDMHVKKNMHRMLTYVLV